MENNFNNEENPIVEDSVISAPTPVEPEVEEEAAVEEVVLEPVLAEEHVDVIEAPVYAEPVEEIPALGNVHGAIGVTTAPKEAKKSAKKSSEKKKETVALRSTKNVTWAEVGKVYTGINIVEKDAAEKWLTRSHITLATPEEVAREFGK